MRNIFRTVFLSIFLLYIFSFSPIYAEESATSAAQLFWADGCPHCERERAFLDRLKQTDESLVIEEFEITKNPEYAQKLGELGKKYNCDVSGVPVLFMSGTCVVGYQDDTTTGEEISRLLTGKPTSFQSKTISLPFFGTVPLTSFSLPVLTIVLGLIDGFNPCAMWTLMFLISLLLGEKDRKRMWILGGTFIIASSGVYFLFLAAWLNAFLFLQYISWVRFFIGCVALGTAMYYFREYQKNKAGVCAVMKDTKKQNAFEKLKKITKQPQIIIAMIGMILLAGAVNTVELICSAGLPAIYTQVVSMSHLLPWQYYGYLFLYIFVFMLDDMVVFATAMVTLRSVGMQGKYAHLSHLIGGIIMAIIGLLMIFKPEWLLFG